MCCGWFHATSMATGHPTSQMQGELSLGTANNFHDSPLPLPDSQKKPQNFIFLKSILCHHLVKTGQQDRSYLSTLREFGNNL